MKEHKVIVTRDKDRDGSCCVWPGNAVPKLVGDIWSGSRLDEIGSQTISQNQCRRLFQYRPRKGSKTVYEIVKVRD